MKKTIVALMCIVSLVIMTACGGSPVDKSLKKIDTAIEKLEKANKKDMQGFLPTKRNL